MRTLNFTGSRDRFHIEDEITLGGRDSTRDILNKLYLEIDNGERTTKKSVSAIVMRLITHAPTLKPLRVVLPTLPVEVGSMLRTELKKTNYRPIVLLDGSDSLGNRLYKEL